MPGSRVPRRLRLGPLRRRIFFFWPGAVGAAEEEEEDDEVAVGFAVVEDIFGGSSGVQVGEESLVLVCLNIVFWAELWCAVVDVIFAIKNYYYRYICMIMIIDN